MKYFLDTEFIEGGKTIDLISIGIVCEDGREYYAVNRGCNFRNASDWVLKNVLLPIGLDRQGLRYPQPSMEGYHAFDRLYIEKTDSFIKSKNQIKKDILWFVKHPWIDHLQSSDYYALHQMSLPEKIEFWGYYADYDWVVFCQLFGKMIDLPEGFPMYCRDLKQLCDSLGNPKLPEQENEHNALDDAKWNKLVYEFLV